MMADFCIATGIPPETFWELTKEEYDALIRAHNRRNAKSG